MKAPSEWDTPEPSEVTEGPPPAPSSSESKEAALKATLESFSGQIAADAVEKFWPDRPKHPELNGNGVNKEELVAKVTPALRAHITKNLHIISVLVFESKDPERAFQGVSALLGREAMEFTKMIYESLTFFKKIGIDELTGLPNRKVFDRNITTGVERNKRFGETFSFILFDLDHFKEVNDTYGHGAGDQVLQEMARRLSKDVKLRELDALVRYGGEEFAIILPSTPKEGACILAQRISDQIGIEPFKIVTKSGEPFEIRVTASIGIAEYAGFTEDPHGKEVQRSADINLYVLKGKEPDHEGITEDRRGRIACDGRVVSKEDIEAFKTKMSGPGRSSFPAPEKG